jgi:hypothetical protein
MACNTPTHLLDGGKELENDGSNCYCELVAMLCVCIQTRTRGLRTAVHSLLSTAGARESLLDESKDARSITSSSLMFEKKIIE